MTIEAKINMLKVSANPINANATPEAALPIAVEKYRTAAFLVAPAALCFGDNEKMAVLFTAQ